MPYQADLDRVCDLMKAVADDVTADERWAREVLEARRRVGRAGARQRRRRRAPGHQDPPGSQFGLLRELRMRLKAAFDVAGIAFAYAGGPTEVVLRDEVPPGSAPGRRPDDDGSDAAPPSASRQRDPSD